MTKASVKVNKVTLNIVSFFVVSWFTLPRVYNVLHDNAPAEHFGFQRWGVILFGAYFGLSVLRKTADQLNYDYTWKFAVIDVIQAGIYAWLINSLFAEYRYAAGTCTHCYYYYVTDFLYLGAIALYLSFIIRNYMVTNSDTYKASFNITPVYKYLFPNWVSVAGIVMSVITFCLEAKYPSDVNRYSFLAFVTISFLLYFIYMFFGFKDVEIRSKEIGRNPNGCAPSH